MTAHIWEPDKVARPMAPASTVICYMAENPLKGLSHGPPRCQIPNCYWHPDREQACYGMLPSKLALTDALASRGRFASRSVARVLRSNANRAWRVLDVEVLCFEATAAAAGLVGPPPCHWGYMMLTSASEIREACGGMWSVLATPGTPSPLGPHQGHPRTPGLWDPGRPIDLLVV